MMKRICQARRLIPARALARNCRHLMTMIRWIVSTAAVQIPAAAVPAQKLDNSPTAPINRNTISDAETRLSANWRNSS